MTSVDSEAALQQSLALWGRLADSPLASSMRSLIQLSHLLLLQHLDVTKSPGLSSGSGAQSDDPIATEIRWSTWRHLSGAEMYDHLARVVYPWLRTSGRETGLPPFATSTAVLQITDPQLLVEVVTRVDQLRFFDLPAETRGLIYNELVQRVEFPKREASRTGKFRTPQHIAATIVEMLAPQITDSVVDPACGTGSFPVEVLAHVLRESTSDELGELPVGDKLTRQQWAWVHDGLLRGVDIDGEMAFVTWMALLVRGLPVPAILEADSLANEDVRATDVSIVVTNSPFARRRARLSGLPLQQAPPALGFLALAGKMLRPGGRAAVIVPDGALFGTTRAHLGVRRALLDDNQVNAVVSFPPGAFRPASGASASLVMFTRGGATEEVWMFDIEGDGFTLDDKRLPSNLNDLPELLHSWPNRETGGKSFAVNADTIRDSDYDLSVGRYRPVVIARTDVPSVDTLLQGLRDIIDLQEREVTHLTELAAAPVSSDQDERG